MQLINQGRHLCTIAAKTSRVIEDVCDRCVWVGDFVAEWGREDRGKESGVRKKDHSSIA
jgi:hypothetical protein